MERKMCDYCILEVTKLTSHLKSCPILSLINDKPRLGKVVQVLLPLILPELDKKLKDLEEENRRLAEMLDEMTSKKNEITKDISKLFDLKPPETKNDEQPLRLLRRKLKPLVPAETLKKTEKEMEAYVDYCNKNEMNLSSESASQYLKAQKQTTYVNTRKNRIKLGLKALIGKVKIKTDTILPKEKFAFDDQVMLNDYLHEQFFVNKTLYVIQVLLVKFGLRVNSAALITWGDLADLEVKLHIKLPDAKQKKMKFIGLCSQEFFLFLRSHLGNEHDHDNELNKVIFFPEINSKSRIEIIRQKISACLKESSIIPHEKSLGYSSHCLRKTRCYMTFSEGYKALIRLCGMTIGHSENSTATETYIRHGTVQMRPEANIPLYDIKGQLINKVYIPNSCPRCGKDIICSDCINPIKDVVNPQQFRKIVPSVTFNFQKFKAPADEASIQSLKSALEEQKLLPFEGLFIIESPERMCGDILNSKDLAVYRSQQGVWSIGSLHVEKDSVAGFYVFTKEEIEKSTLICEYGGDIMTFQDSTKNDSIFMFEGESKVCICPTIHSNIGKYIAGIGPKMTPNMSTNQCMIDGSPHILVYANQNIPAGHALLYDYSRFGNYPNEHFIDLNTEERIKERLVKYHKI